MTKTYRDGRDLVWACHEVTLNVPAGVLVSVRGPSGSGKSTLLTVAAGLVEVDSGSVVVSGVTMAGPEADRAKARLTRVGMVFQDFLLVDEFTAAENVMLPLESQGWGSGRARQEAERWLDVVGLGDLAHRRPAQLSGGQRQRVAIARAVAGQKALLLADEPTGSLDSRTSAGIFELLRHLADAGAAVVVASHDPRCSDYADQAYDMLDGTLTTIDRRATV